MLATKAFLLPNLTNALTLLCVAAAGAATRDDIPPSTPCVIIAVMSEVSNVEREREMQLGELSNIEGALPSALER